MGQTRKLPVGFWRRNSRMAFKVWQATLTPLEEKTYNFGRDDEDNCQDAVETGNLSAKMTIK